MDTRKLDKWADLLLDTGKRNPLINFSDNKPLTVEVLMPDSDVLFNKIDGSTSFEVYDSKIIEDEDENDISDTTADAVDDEIEETDGAAEQVGLKGFEDTTKAEQFEIQNFPAEKLPEKEQSERDGKAAYLEQYSRKIRRQNQLLLYSSRSGTMTAIKKIDKKTHEFIEETGVNVAYMAFGFIHWKESDSSSYVYHAPVLLIPIQLEQASGIEPYYIKSTGDDIIVNPTFAYKMDAEHGVKLPDYEEEGLTAYLEKVQKIVSKLQWSVTAECKIGIFSFLKINMYRDLKDHAAAILANQNIRLLLGEPVDHDQLSRESDEADRVEDPLIQLHSVVDADSSQIEAIELARAGKSFVLQGPPGTGKSQTITNIIAECLGNGKKVLFVSEKLAALNVVYEKLKQAGLSEFCLELHSHKANKKDVIEDICHTLRASKSALSSKAENEIAIKEKAEKQLDAYAAELHMHRPVIEKSLYQLYEDFAALRNVPDISWVVPQLSTRGEGYLTDVVPLLEQYVDFIPSVGYDYHKNPWYGYVNQDTSYQIKNDIKDAISATVKLLDSLIPVQKELSERYAVTCDSIQEAKNWRDFFRFCSTSKIITPALLKKDEFDSVNAALQDLQSRSAEILNCQSVLDSTFDDAVYKIDGDGYYRKLTKQFNSLFSRLFNAEYKQIVGDIRLCKKDGKKPTYDEAVAMMERLSFYQQKSQEYAASEQPVREFLGSAYAGVNTEWDYVTNQMHTLQEMFATEISFGKLIEFADFSEGQNCFEEYANRLDAAFSACGAESIARLISSFDKTILNIENSESSILLGRLNDCMREIGKIDNWCHFRNLLSELRDKEVIPYIDAAIQANVEGKYFVAGFKKQFYYQWIDSILSASPVLSAFNRVSQDNAIRTFAEKDTEQFEINKAKIRAELSANRPSVDMIAPGSALAVLLREGEKKRKQKSIRTLLAETGELIQKIKPCFLMSPLSVSTYLATDSVHFDVVVFDEASQIFPQDAIGAIYRANQLIVVGDSKQMPPSNFFNTSVEVEDNDEETGDVTDFESILDLCSTSMQQLRLRWHYRSRYEQLITFSNKNFYDNDLVTFPSSKADAPGLGVDYYYVDGIFDRKSHNNRKEAEFVVDLIYQNIEKYPDRSLGVVAFSVAQQDLIDKLLSKRRQNTPEKEFFFKNNANEPFFIKNLETVQGDERDTIIFSVAYGKDSQGRLLHNFGPLNRVGGERRLNVAVTRAKCNVQLVSSMHYTDIDLKRTSAEGAKLLKEYLDFAENGEIALERAVSVSSYDQFDSDFELEVCEFLREHGFEVDTQVGCSGFRIDLGLRSPGTADYVLAIECDGATYHSSKNARDRDRLRQEILERMGWNFYRIWSTDWFRNREVEQKNLLEVATNAVKNLPKPETKKQAPKEQETFEVETIEKPFEFPAYEAADVFRLSHKHPSWDFKGFIKAILEVEAPLSEDLLLKRIVWLFDREKVTSVVQKEYERKMRFCEESGIIRRNGFLYLDDGPEIRFRRPGDIERDIKQIAPEELAAGMLEILRQNVTADKTGLFRSIAQQCGVNRVGKAINEHLDRALLTLRDQIIIDGDQVSLKEL